MGTDTLLQLYAAQRRFNRACNQIVLLGERLADLRRRYGAARSQGNCVFRRSLRLRLLTVEGLVKTFTHYATLKKNEMISLRRKLYSPYAAADESDPEDSDDGDYSSDEE